MFHGCLVMAKIYLSFIHDEANPWYKEESLNLNGNVLL